jgi:uncharacterized protein (TIGR02118 family)
MYKLYAYWSAPRPEDEAAFEEHYLGTHVPLAAAVPHLSSIITTRTDVGLEGHAPPYYRVAEMIFPSAELMAESAATETWGKVREDAGKLIERFGVEMTVGMGEELTHPTTAGS